MQKVLTHVRGSAPYFIAQEWDELFLVKFKAYVDDMRDKKLVVLSSSSLVGIYSAAGLAVERAAQAGALRTRSIQRIPVGVALPETDSHSAYSDFELKQIVPALEHELAFTEAVSRPPTVQVPAGAIDPRIRHKRPVGWGYGPEANMRWYFVNVLGCRPILGAGEDKKQHRGFLSAATNLHGGLHVLYRSWNVAAQIDENVLMPLVTWLNYITGLNPSTVLAMEVDSYQESHPLTGQPFLKLYKLRSGGEIELHLPLLDGTPTLLLKGKQSVWVRRVFDLALKLTERIRSRLESHDERRKLLFVYESSGGNMWNQVNVLSDRQSSAWRKRMTEKYNLRKEDGTSLAFTNVRFRPTLLTQMVLAGRDLLEVQAVASQRNIGTTLKYIAVRQVTDAGRKRLAAALTDIRTNRLEFEKATREQQQAKRVIPIKSYKGLISDCKNVYDPPAHIRARSNYVQGEGCTQFNMCLLCKNIIVFRQHLPILAHYRKQIRSSSTADMPNASMYDTTLDVLDNLFDPNFGEFGAQDIAWAEEQAMYMDVVIDPAIYKPVMQ